MSTATTRINLNPIDPKMLQINKAATTGFAVYIAPKEPIITAQYKSPSGANDTNGTGGGKEWIVWVMGGVALVAALWYIIFKMK